MKIIKCGGKVLKNYDYRKKLYNEIKESKEKTILVVSAFNESPYSTSSFRKLLNNNYTYEMEQEIIILGEIISSIIVTNELKNEYIDAEVLYKEEIGIYVKTSDKMEEIIKLDPKYIKDKIDKHNVLVIPGFIGINQHNKFVSLNNNGSDLTAILVAKMLGINEVYLYKDVLGLSSINPKDNTDYKLYKKVNYSLMHQIIIHGNDLLQEQALIVAKDNNIIINISHYINHSYNTLISKTSNEPVVVIQRNNNCIYIDGYYNKELIENYLISNNISYDYVLSCNSFIKIVTSFNNEKIIENQLHKALLKGNL